MSNSSVQEVMTISYFSGLLIALSLLLSSATMQLRSRLWLGPLISTAFWCQEEELQIEQSDLGIL